MLESNADPDAFVRSLRSQIPTPVVSQQQSTTSFLLLRTSDTTYVVAVEHRFPLKDFENLTAGENTVVLALYRSPRAEPDSLRLATAAELPLTGQTVSVPVVQESFDGTLVVAERHPLTTGVIRVLPETVAAIGLLLTTVFTLFSWMMGRRRGLLRQLTSEKARLDLVIAEHPRTLGELEANLERYRRILDSSPDIIVLLTLDSGRVTILNRQDLLGHDSASFNLIGLAKILAADALVGFAEAMDTVCRNPDRTIESEARVRNANDEWEWIRYRLAAIPEPNRKEPNHIVAVITKITEIKKAAEKQAQLEHQLRQAQRLEALGQLAGGVAHDLNNVLAAIMSLAELVGLEPQSEQATTDLAEVKQTTRRGAALVRQLLIFARHDLPSRAAIDLNAVVSGFEHLLHRTLSQSIGVEVQLTPNLPAILGDPSEIEQVLLNLAINARDAMAGGGLLRIETTLVWLDEIYAETHADVTCGPYVRLLVADTGSGMSPEVQARIFDPFYTTKPVGQGTGLGLATVYGILTQQGGHIDVYSEQGHGTAFKLYFPIADREAAVASHRPKEVIRRGDGRRVLLVEDEDVIRAATARILVGHGYEVVTAANGPSAAAIALTQHFDLAVVDIVMPGGMSGRDVVAKLRNNQPDLAALYMSGYSEEFMAAGNTERGGGTGGVLLLEKPFQAEELLRLADRALADRALVDSEPANGVGVDGRLPV